MAWIYKITSPKGKSYVGSTVNIKKRFSAHKGMYKKNHRKLYDSFIEYGVENHNFEILCECDTERMKELETYYGTLYNCLDSEYGLNLALPVGRSSDYIVNGFEKGFTPWNKGGKGLQKAWNKGIPMYDDVKRKVSEAKKGKPSPKKGIKTGIPTHNSKLIMCIETGVFYYSSTEAATYSKYSRQNINRMLDGNIKNKTTLRYV